jgi:hypothetical protein
VTSFSCGDLVAMPCHLAPRTAVALSQDRKTLWLVVVDGWQSGSSGLTAAQLAAFIGGDLGAHESLMLDGGSASALVLDGALKSSPSDGVERPVANHLAIRHGALPDGLMLGVVAEGAVTGPRIAGALVTMDDGRQKTYDGENLWSFTVRPRWACVSASAPGYQTATQCRQVPSDGEIYASLALQPEGAGGGDAGPDQPDAGPMADAAPMPDAGEVFADAGVDPDPRGGCGCLAAGGGRSAPASTLLLLLAALWLRGIRPSRPRNR